MTSEIRVLSNEELARFARIAREAYPSFTTPVDELAERLVRNRANMPYTEYYGLFRDDRLLGGMRHFDFTMSYHGIAMLTGGVGLVAVDLLHKKEHVARELISFFLRHYRERGAPLVSLYPFRPDFYRQMGFGYGTRMNQYRVRPASLPPGPGKSHLRVLGRDDAPALLDCYNRYAARTHGFYLHEEVWANRLFDDPERHILAYVEAGQVQGYIVYHFVRGHSFLLNDIEVEELIYEHSAALRELLHYLRTQADQIDTLIINTQDAQLHQLLHDPRNGTGNMIPSVYHETNTQGLGIMYRVTDTAGLFQALAGHSFGGQNLTLALRLRDSFLPENDGETVIRFTDGRPALAPGAQPDVTLSIAVDLFSALVMGSADFYSLYRYGLAEIDDPTYSGTVYRLFLSEVAPMCLTAF